MLPVRAFGFKSVGQTCENHGDLRFFRRFDGFLQQRFIRGIAVGVIAPGIPHGVARCFQGADSMGHVDVAGACALIAGLFGKFADERHFLTFFQRQEMALVLHQHGAFACQLPGQFAAGFPVNGRVGPALFHGILHELQQPQNGFVKICFIKGASLDCFHDLLAGGVGSAGHFQIQARGHALGLIFDGAPVGDHEGVGMPLVPQDVSEQHFVLRAEGAIDGVVGTHEAASLALLHHRFKGGQIDFPKRPIVQVGGTAHAQRFLIVAGKVLCAGGNAFPLQRLHVGGAHFARQIGVLGKILKVPPAQGAALDVETGPQQHGHVFRLAFLSERFAKLTHHVPVKGGGQGGSGGIAHRFDALVDAQVVALALLFAQTVRPVAHHHRRNA